MASDATYDLGDSHGAYSTSVQYVQCGYNEYKQAFAGNGCPEKLLHTRHSQKDHCKNQTPLNQCETSQLMMNVEMPHFPFE